jgi:hypothetical protein
MRALIQSSLIGTLICGLIPHSALAQDKSPTGLVSIDIADTDRQIGLIWNASIVPGEEVLTVKNVNTRYGTTFYSRYQFAGVVGSSLQINQTGATQDKGATAARESSSMSKTFYVERAADGAFYFAPEELKDVGVFSIVRSQQDPARYSVKFTRRKS